MLFALQDAALASVIRRIGPGSSPADIEQVLELVRGSDALARSEAVSQDYLARAAAIVEQLSSFPAHADLKTLLQYFAGRDR